MKDKADIGHTLIKGRRWRTSDPAIPDALRQSLVNELMASRRAVARALREQSSSQEKAARARVQDAKVALGERGPKWWQKLSATDVEERATATVYALLRARSATSSVCPSEVARAVNGKSWRPLMEPVRAHCYRLAKTGAVVVMQQGEVVDANARGPVRVGRGERFPYGLAPERSAARASKSAKPGRITKTARAD